MIIELETCSPDFNKEHLSPIKLKEPAFSISKEEQKKKYKYEHPSSDLYERRDFIYYKTANDIQEDKRISMNHGTAVGYMEISRRSHNAAAFCKNCGVIGTAKWKFIDCNLHQGYNPYICYSKFKSGFTREKDNPLLQPVFKRHNEISFLKSEAEKEHKNFERQICPVCKSQFSHIKKEKYENSWFPGISDDYYERSFKESLNDKISEIQNEVAAEDTEIAKSLAKDINIRCNLPVRMTVPANQLEVIRHNPSNLKQYLLTLINLEAEIYSLTKRLQSLYYHRISADRSVVLAKHLPAKSARKETDRLIQQAEAEYNRLKDQLNHLKNNYPKHPKPEKPEIHLPPAPEKPASPVLETPKLFNKKKVLAANAAKEKEYALALEKYERDVEAHWRKVKQIEADAERDWKKLLEKHNANKIKIQEQHKKKIEKAEKEVQSALEKLNRTKIESKEKIEQAKSISNHPALAVKSTIDSEIEQAEALLHKSYETRNALYSLDIVFIKYRNIVALSSFYEYLMAGRVETLEGSNGAYNIYESEIRMDTIISQLDRVIESLEQIKENQYMIYSKLEEINSNLYSLTCTTEKMFSALKSVEENTATTAQNTAVIAQNSAITAHNTAVTAFYAKKNAELTNALGYLVALQ